MLWVIKVRRIVSKTRYQISQREICARARPPRTNPYGWYGAGALARLPHTEPKALVWGFGLRDGFFNNPSSHFYYLIRKASICS
jgi:hypothetical protein